MANRDPKLCSQAVQDYWNGERDLVRDGQGSRDWTPEQQESIMNYKADGTERANAGVPKDEDGKSFEGHHMKSAEAHPEYQGSADNIQPLTRDEHLAAHNGNYQNPTNGYYDPSTGVTTDFGQGEPTKPEPVNLSEPINARSQANEPSDDINSTVKPSPETPQSSQDKDETTDNKPSDDINSTVKPGTEASQDKGETIDNKPSNDINSTVTPSQDATNPAKSEPSSDINLSQ
jgi:hypothetical protein